MPTRLALDGHCIHTLSVSQVRCAFAGRVMGLHAALDVLHGWGKAIRGHFARR